MNGMALVVGALAFLSELVLWGGLGYAVFRLSAGAGVVLAVLAGIVAAAALIAFWSLWMAPQASHRLPTWSRVVVASTMFVGLGALLTAAGMPRAGVAIAVVGVAINAFAEPTVKLG